MIAVMQIRTRMVHVVVSIVSCATSDRGIGVLFSILILFTFRGKILYCVFLFPKKTVSRIVRSKERARTHQVFLWEGANNLVDSRSVEVSIYDQVMGSVTHALV